MKCAFSILLVWVALCSYVHAVYRVENYYSNRYCHGHVEFTYVRHKDPCDCPWTCEQNTEIPYYWEFCMCVSDVDFDDIFLASPWVAQTHGYDTPSCGGAYNEALVLPNNTCTEIIDHTYRRFTCTGHEVQVSVCDGTECEGTCDESLFPLDSCVPDLDTYQRFACTSASCVPPVFISIAAVVTVVSLLF